MVRVFSAVRRYGPVPRIVLSGEKSWLEIGSSLPVNQRRKVVCKWPFPYN